MALVCRISPRQHGWTPIGCLVNSARTAARPAGLTRNLSWTGAGHRIPAVGNTKPIDLRRRCAHTMDGIARQFAVHDMAEGLPGLWPFDYSTCMYTIKTLPEFSAWLDGLKDAQTRIRLNKRLRKATLGNLGDVKPVGEGVSEMREFFGPGWRMYYVQRGSVLIVMLGGGEKSAQQADIAAAIALAKTLEE